MAFLFIMRVSVLLLALLKMSVEAFVPPGAHSPHGRTVSRLEAHDTSRRNVIFSAAALVVAMPKAVEAGIDPSALRNLPVEGDSGGAAMRLRQIDAVQRPESDLINTPWEELSDGVQYREYREGKGDAGMLSTLQCVPECHVSWLTPPVLSSLSHHAQSSRMDPRWQPK